MILEMKPVKYTTLDQRTVVSFVQQPPEGEEAHIDPFTITASPSGVSFKGVMKGELQTQADLQAFAKLIADVWKERLKLRPTIVMSESGH